MGELILLLTNVTLQVNKEDNWLWTLENSNTFTVRSLYNFLTIQSQVDLPVDASSLWHKDVPLKVVLFAWRLFRDRLSTKDNLLRRGVINYDSRTCVAGCDLVESSPHLFLHCIIFGSVWHLIYSWIGVSVTTPFSVPDHFHQFSFIIGIGNKRRSILQVIWYATVISTLINIKQFNQIINIIKSTKPKYVTIYSKKSNNNKKKPIQYYNKLLLDFVILICV